MPAMPCIIDNDQHDHLGAILKPLERSTFFESKILQDILFALTDVRLEGHPPKLLFDVNLDLGRFPTLTQRALTQ